MTFEQRINAKLEKLFGKDADGERRVWFHWQNLNEDRKGNPKGWPYEGRAWLHVPKPGSPRRWGVAGFSWHLASRFCGFSVGTDSEDGGISLHASLPPVALWLTLPIPVQALLNRPFWARWNERVGGYPGSHRYTAFRLADVRIHDWTLHWDFLKFDWGWSSQMPKWMDGGVDVRQLVLGKRVYEEKVFDQRDISIPMPEGEYPARALVYDAIRGWERLPWRQRTAHVRIDVSRGIPFSGKGENSWDCGEDGLWGWSGPARSVGEAIGKVVASVLETRSKRGDPLKWPRAPGETPTPPAGEQSPPPEASA